MTAMDWQRTRHKLFVTSLIIMVLPTAIACGDGLYPCLTGSTGSVATDSCIGGVDDQRCTPAGNHHAGGHSLDLSTDWRFARLEDAAAAAPTGWDLLRDPTLWSSGNGHADGLGSDLGSDWRFDHSGDTAAAAPTGWDLLRDPTLWSSGADPATNTVPPRPPSACDQLSDPPKCTLVASDDTSASHSAPLQGIAADNEANGAEEAIGSGAAPAIVFQGDCAYIGSAHVDQQQQQEKRPQPPSSPSAEAHSLAAPAAPFLADDVVGTAAAAVAIVVGALLVFTLGVGLGASLARRAGSARLPRPVLLDASTQTDTERMAATRDERPPTAPQQQHQQRPRGRGPEPASSQTSLRGPRLPGRDVSARKTSSAQSSHHQQHKQHSGHAASATGRGVPVAAVAAAAIAASGVYRHNSGGYAAGDVTATATSGVRADTDADAPSPTTSIGVSISELTPQGYKAAADDGCECNPKGTGVIRNPRRSSGSSCSSCSGGPGDRDAGGSSEASSTGGTKAMRGKESEGCSSEAAPPPVVTAASTTPLAPAGGVVATAAATNEDGAPSVSVSATTATVELPQPPSPLGPQQMQQQPYQLMLAQMQMQALAQFQALSLIQQQQQLAQQFQAQQPYGPGSGFLPRGQWGSAMADATSLPPDGGPQASAVASTWGSDGGALMAGGGFGQALLSGWPGMAGPFCGASYGGAAGPYSQPIHPQQRTQQMQMQLPANTQIQQHPAHNSQTQLLQASAASTMAGGGGGVVAVSGGGGELMVPASEVHNALIAMVNGVVDAFSMRMTEVAAVVSDASFAVRDLSGDVREGAGLLRRVIGGWELEAQRGMVAAAMQRGLVVMWVALVGASVRWGRWRAVVWTCSQEGPARAPEFTAASSAAGPSAGWLGLRVAGWTLGLSGRGGGSSGNSWGSWGLGWAWDRLLGSVGSRLLPAWMRVVACYCHELGLYALGLVFVAWLLRPLLRNTLSVDLRHSWAVDVPLLLGGIWGVVGCQVVSSLGGRWTVWLAGWWAWCALGGVLYARRLRGGGWVQAAALAGLTLAAPAAIGMVPYMEWAQPAHEAMEEWWRAAAEGVVAALGGAEVDGGRAGAVEGFGAAPQPEGR